MSRVIVKNLPARADEIRIREHFSSQGTITDIKLLKKKDGSSRRFAFIGFRSNDEAERAAEFFHESYMNTSKLDVSLAKQLNDPSLISRHDIRKRKLSEEYAKVSKAQLKYRRGSSDKTRDPKLAEYVALTKPKGDHATWRPLDAGKASEVSREASSAVEYESDEDINEAPTVELFDSSVQKVDRDKQLGLPDQVLLTSPSLSVGESDSLSVDEGEKPQNPTESGDEKSNDRNALVSDLDWLNSRRVRIKENGDKPAPANAAGSSVAVITTSDNPQLTDEQKIRSSSRLFLRNLPYSVSSDDLLALVSPYGNNVEVHLPVDPKTDEIKGFAFIKFQDPDEAVDAFRVLDGTIFQGRLLHILPAQPTKDYKLDEFDLQNMPLKKRQLLEKRASASHAQFSWNSLYLNQDAALETVAARLGVTKSEILDPHSSNMAVKKALAESSVLQSVQSYFTSKGVDVAKFQIKETTDKVILVKNIPYNTSIEEIRDLFSTYGTVVRTLMPSEGGLAIVQFETAAGGRLAFTKLSFRRLRNSILYLQKAPEGVLDRVQDSEGAEKSSELTQPGEKALSGKDLLAVSESANSTNTAESHVSLFVKNLNFQTDVAGLVNLFKQMDGFVTAQVKTKPDAANPAKRLSMGFGFVEFETLAQAETARDALQGYTLDNHSLQLRLSTRGTNDNKLSHRKARVGIAKIIIKNLPFETSKRDIVDLFGTFGQLRTVRLPRKHNKASRGFAFAEFATPKEAAHAMESLQGAHLLGRRLIMDFAEADAEDPEEEIARMEAKMRSQVNAENLASMRLTGQRKGFDMEQTNTF